MKFANLTIGLITIMVAAGAGAAHAAENDVVIGDIDDLSGVYADIQGPAAVDVVKTAIIETGGKTWFYLTTDYAFGMQLQNAASKVVEQRGGKNVGAVRAPLSASDFSSFLLQAQASGAQVLGLANAGNDFTNSLKAANEFGITRTMKPAALLAFITDIHSLGLQIAQGLYLTTAW